MEPNRRRTATEEAGQADVQFRRKKRWVLGLLFAYAVVFGVVAAMLPEHDDPATELAVGMPFLFLGVSWCFVDAGQRGYRIGMVMRVVLVLFFVFALPVYVFRTRGLGGFKTLALITLVIGAAYACAVAAMMAAWLVAT